MQTENKNEIPTLNEKDSTTQVSLYSPQQKTIAMLIVGFAIGFACALPIGYSAGHKTSTKIYNKKLAENANRMVISSEAEAAGQRTVLEEYQRKNTYFKVPSSKGGELSLDQYKDKPVLLMFYTENCPYCRKAAPELEKIYKKYAEKGLAVIGLCGQTEKEAPIRFSKDLGLTFPMGYNAFDAMRKYGVQGVPYIYLLNKNHELEDVWPGFSYEYVDIMNESVQKVLAD